MFAGGLLLLMQLHGYQHSAFTEDFPLNKDDHYHTHADMQVAAPPSALEGYEKRVTLPPKPLANTPPHEHGDGVVHTH